MSREQLHGLIDQLPDDELAKVSRFVESLGKRSLPLEDETISQAEADEIRRARADIQAGRFVSHEEILRDLEVA